MLGILRVLSFPKWNITEIEKGPQQHAPFIFIRYKRKTTSTEYWFARPSNEVVLACCYILLFKPQKTQKKKEQTG